MGVIWKKYMNAHARLGLWEITETFDDLRSQLKLCKEEEMILRDFKSLARQIEWLSVRVLLKELASENLSIIYNQNRKPLIKNRDINISISHSRNLTSIFLSHVRKVGIDLEYMSHRIRKIEHKFINDAEYITPDENLRKFHLYVHWCAKEALYKICDKQNINFKENLTIEAFEPAEKGILKGWVNNPFIQETFTLEYFTYDNYIIVWTCQ